MKIIKQCDYRTTAWTGGITREILILPEGASLAHRKFDIRISSAIIETTESDFSDFQGFDRYILPIEGRITLMRENQTIILSPHQPFHFGGEEKVSSKNTPKAIDFNVIFRKGRQVEVEWKKTDSPIALGDCLLFALSPLKVGKIQIEKHDSLVLESKEMVSGEMIIVKFRHF
ncbi:MAG: HutD family protein [Prevotella sp.]|nr:HutD family protein [Prevotella sp.]MDY4218452.1 HutD family protein [Prevotella sp.]